MEEHVVREHLSKLLDWSEAHRSLAEAVAGLPPELRGKRPDTLPFSVWELVDHIRLALEDIVSFCADDEYEEMEWPGDYWPDEPTVDEVGWEASLESIRAGIRQLQKIVSDPRRDLTAAVPNGSGQTLLREILLAADHTAYHTGEIILVRKALGAWPPAEASPEG